MCIDEKCCMYWIYICSRMNSLKVSFLCALMKNVASTRYIFSRSIGYINICSRMQLKLNYIIFILEWKMCGTCFVISILLSIESSFSMCIDEKCCTYSIYTQIECDQFFSWDFLVKNIDNVNKSSQYSFVWRFLSDKRLKALLRLLVGFDSHLYSWKKIVQIFSVQWSDMF